MIEDALKNGQMIKVSDDEYHSEAFSRGGIYHSSHGISEFRKSPHLAWMKHQGLIQDEQTDGLRFGRAFHAALLDPEEFKNFLIIPPDHITPSGNLSTKKATKDWLQSNPNCYLPDEGDMFDRMRESIAVNRDSERLMQTPYKEYATRVSYLDVDLHAKFDLISDEWVGDLKSIDNINNWKGHLYKYNYLRQLGFYALCALTAGIPIRTAYLIFAEKAATRRTKVIEISEQKLEDAIEDVVGIIEPIKRCDPNNGKDWPAVYPGDEYELLT